MNASSSATVPLRLNGVHRAFDRKVVLDSVTATACAGKTIGLLGRNGSGKTTLFRILLDLLAADRGEIEVLGMKPDGSGRIRARVGSFPDQPRFPAYWTGEEALLWRSRFLPDFSLERARRWAKGLELDLTEKLRRPSLGTVNKLSWLCAAAHAPALLLLDEPTNGMDLPAREYATREILGWLRSEGRTIIVSNHHMELISDQLDELWLLRSGQITIHPVIAPATDLVRDLLIGGGASGDA